MKKYFTLLFITLFICLLLCPDRNRSFGAEEEAAEEMTQEDNFSPVAGSEDRWFIIRSNFLQIYCDTDVELKNVSRNLSRRSLFSSGVYDPSPASAPTNKVAYRLDRLFKRAREILDMYPKIPDLKIKIFKDRDALADEYEKLMGTRKEYKAFYIDQHKTIYTSEEDISDSVIAHEMGHAIVDHYFSAVPPERVRELLATYVDLHLEED